MRTPRTVRQRACVLTLPIGGLMGAVALLLRGPVSPLPEVDPAAWTAAVTSSIYPLAQYTYIVAYVLPFLGFWALYDLLARASKVERTAFWGFMGAIAGTALALPTLGVFAYVSPLVGQLYSGGQSQLLEIISAVVTGPPVVINLLGGTVYLAGTILLGVATWRGGVLPRWSGVLLALHGTCLVFGFAVLPVLVLGWLLLVVAGGWISWAIRSR